MIFAWHELPKSESSFQHGYIWREVGGHHALSSVLGSATGGGERGRRRNPSWTRRLSFLNGNRLQSCSGKAVEKSGVLSNKKSWNAVLANFLE